MNSWCNFVIVASTNHYLIDEIQAACLQRVGEFCSSIKPASIVSCPISCHAPILHSSQNVRPEVLGRNVSLWFIVTSSSPFRSWAGVVVAVVVVRFGDKRGTTATTEIVAELGRDTEPLTLVGINKLLLLLLPFVGFFLSFHLLAVVVLDCVDDFLGNVVATNRRSCHGVFLFSRALKILFQLLESFGLSPLGIESGFDRLERFFLALGQFVENSSSISRVRAARITLLKRGSGFVAQEDLTGGSTGHRVLGFLSTYYAQDKLPVRVGNSPDFLPCGPGPSGHFVKSSEAFLVQIVPNPDTLVGNLQLV
mmetsp:Transcript_22628/g.45960  ORF Transcript_22628/g.45960 Transcript_22628/m.45960 type:complete len:309 (+) Transcript_22628:398-1324(+)